MTDKTTESFTSTDSPLGLSKEQQAVVASLPKAEQNAKIMEFIAKNKGIEPKLTPEQIAANKEKEYGYSTGIGNTGESDYADHLIAHQLGLLTPHPDMRKTHPELFSGVYDFDIMSGKDKAYNKAVAENDKAKSDWLDSRMDTNWTGVALVYGVPIAGVLLALYLKRNL